MTVVDHLIRLGFSRYEAQAYAALLQSSPQNGYELARASGVPRPNIYAVLARLEERGAIMRVDEEAGTKFVPLPSDELLRRLREDFERTLHDAEATLREVGEKVQWEPVKNLRGYESAIAAAKDLIRSCDKELLLAVWPEEAEALDEETARAAAKGVRITTLCLAACPQRCEHCRGDVHRHLVDAGGKSRWLVLAADSAEMMTAEITWRDAQAVRTRQKLLVELAAWYIRHTIAVASLVDDLRAAGPASLSPHTRRILEAIGSHVSGHDWLDGMRELLESAADDSAN